MRKRISFGYCMIIFVLIILAFICFYPLWYTLIVSFSDKSQVAAGKVIILPKGFNLNAYQKLLQDPNFISAFFVSVRRVILGCSVNMLLLIMSAYPLCVPERRFRAGKFFKWFFIANMIFTGGMIPSFVLIREYDLFDSIWALILPTAVPLWNMVLMINFFRNVPYELHEAAQIDGANPWQILWRIYVPLCIPSLACILLFQFVAHWNTWFDGLIYINDLSKQPLQTYIYQLTTVIDPQTMSTEEIREALKMSDLTLNAAKVIISLLPIAAIYPLLQRYFISGMTLGSVKG